MNTAVQERQPLKLDQAAIDKASKASKKAP